MPCVEGNICEGSVTRLGTAHADVGRAAHLRNALTSHARAKQINGVGGTRGDRTSATATHKPLRRTAVARKRLRHYFISLKLPRGGDVVSAGLARHSMNQRTCTTPYDTHNTVPA